MLREQLIDICVETIRSRQPEPWPAQEPIPPQTAPEKPEGLEVRLHGRLKNETAFRVSAPTGWTQLRNQLFLAQTGRLSEDLHFKATERVSYDPVYDLTHRFPNSARSDQRWEAELRDTYLDYSRGPFDLRLGKQQIVWGEAVGLFFADVVNAKDLREFVLPDFDLIRIPEWAADLEYSSENFHAELVWLPIPEFNRLGVTGSEFRFPPPLPSPETPFTTTDPVEPGNQLENSEIGGRLSILRGGWDLSAFYLHTWDKSPVNFRTLRGDVFDFSPGYKRLNLLGASFSKEVRDVIFKGELVFSRKGRFSIFDSTDWDGVTRRDFIDYLVGADTTFFEKLDTNLQFMQRVIFNHSPLLAENERPVRNSLSFWAKTDFLDKKLEPELLVIASLMEADFLIRPKLSYKINDHWRWRLGADLFQGSPDGIFGRFDKRDRLYTEMIFEF